ncbi:hypothetical protein Hanom_Chr15g01380361 [Helianthus anomalus]
MAKVTKPQGRKWQLTLYFFLKLRHLFYMLNIICKIIINSNLKVQKYFISHLVLYH